MDLSSLQESTHLKDYLDVLRRRREAVVIFFLATVLAVSLGTLLMRPVYRATATLLIDVESPNVLTTSGAVELGSQNYYSYKDYLQTQMEILISRPIIRQVFDEFKQSGSPEYAQAKDPVKKFLKTVRIEPLRDTRLIQLSVDNKEPLLAAQIANRIAELYVTRNLAYISKNELMNLLKNEYLKLEGKLSENAKVYKDDHPEMIRIKQEIAELVEKIEQEKKIVSTYGEQDKKSRNVYAGTLEGLKANNVSITEPAEKPLVPIKPKKAVNLLLGILLGALGGIGLAFFLEYLDDTVKDVEEIEQLTSLPILGSVPRIGGRLKLEKGERDIFVHINPKDPISESYRAFRTNLAFSVPDAGKLKNILVTSPGPGEGKTITLCNLGIAFAKNKKRVLLVDADMRKPRVHEAFSRKNKTGLADFLSGEADFESVIQKTNIENLSLVSSGPIPPNPAELLATDKLQEFIELAGQKFDLVIFDSPPVALLTDATIIARSIDSFVMVIESGKTSRRALARISKLLRESRIRVSGVFLNKMDLSNKNYYYYSGYYSHYGQKATPLKGDVVKPPV